ncbi:hypothetical protein B0H17DRAFT_1200414 [Mycena rosella]|uniref:Uncharacterized protein n=1 Tax=Mycena rosella TaxID=1033263 RepID=A0AAD7DJ46_MYCRO|nr:hypothetical protein B0H17DRAFT_1200414 [Mycena rosella]
MSRIGVIPESDQGKTKSTHSCSISAATNIPRRVTLSALQFFVLHCPKLIHLRLDLDARDVPPIAEQPAQNALNSLNIGYSPLTDSFAVAGFLFVILPALSEIAADGHMRMHGRVRYEDDIPNLAWAYHKRWKNVGNKLTRKRDALGLKLDAREPRSAAYTRRPC